MFLMGSSRFLVVSALENTEDQKQLIAEAVEQIASAPFLMDLRILALLWVIVGV